MRSDRRTRPPRSPRRSGRSGRSRRAGRCTVKPRSASRQDTAGTSRRCTSWMHPSGRGCRSSPRSGSSPCRTCTHTALSRHRTSNRAAQVRKGSRPARGPERAAPAKARRGRVYTVAAPRPASARHAHLRAACHLARRAQSASPSGGSGSSSRSPARGGGCAAPRLPRPSGGRFSGRKRPALPKCGERGPRVLAPLAADIPAAPVPSRDRPGSLSSSVRRSLSKICRWLLRALHRASRGRATR
jgi:hypothetical protein